MTDVLLGQGYYLRFDPKLWDAQQPYAPLGTLYAASWLRSRGRSVALFDAMLARSERDWAAALEREQPRLAVVYEDSFNYLSKLCLLRMRQASLAMLRLARARGCVTAVAGSDATDHPQAYLEGGADYVIAGEGEGTLGELADAVLAGPRSAPGADDVAGLWALGPDRTPRRGAPRPLLRDLDALPWPAWDLVDVEAYRRIWTARHGFFSMNLATTRGCPYHCNWCAKPIWGQRYTVRRPDAVADEIAGLRERYRPDHLSVVDDIFGLQPGWVEAFADALAARGAVTPFKCLSRADLLSEPVVAALRRAGCRSAWIGAESGSQQVLDAMEKGITVEQIREAAQRLHAASIQVGFFLQFGYPGETRDDVEATLALVRQCRPDDVGISVSYPLPGTRFHERVKQQLGAKRHWVDSDDLAMLYRGPYPTAFYRRLHTVVHKELRLARLDQGRPLEPGAGARAASLRRVLQKLYLQATLPLDRLRLERLARRPHAPIGALPAGLAPADAARPTAPEA